MYGINRDPSGDSQAGAADTDIVGDASHGSLYAAYDDNGSPSSLDDRLQFRMRIDNPTSPEVFSGVAMVGLDANQDGRVDIFLSVDGRKSVQAVRFLDPGAGLNNSPSTTTTGPLPQGWLPNNGIYPMTSNNSSMVLVSTTTDPHWNGDIDLGNDGKHDLFVSWSVPMADLAAVLAKPSPVNRSGAYGPRGATGIAGFSKNTSVAYVCFTQTQPGPINGDLNGVGASFDRNATYGSLGALTPTMSVGAPVADGPSLAIDVPISDGGVINRGEGNSLLVSGTSSYMTGHMLEIQISDGILSVTGTAIVAENGAWQTNPLNVSGLGEGPLTVVVTGDPDTNPLTVNSVSATATVQHDTVAPLLTVSPLPGTTVGKPVLGGTTDLPDGSLVSIEIDTDNEPTTAGLSYQALVLSGTWSLNTGEVTPLAGTMPTAGLTRYAKVSVTATDAAGNATETTLLNRPSVNAQATNRTKPSLSGCWTRLEGGSTSGNSRRSDVRSKSIRERLGCGSDDRGASLGHAQRPGKRQCV